MDFIKVKDKDYLFRDPNSQAIVNGDIDGYKKYEENYKKIYNSNKKIKSLENDVNEIKNDLNEIKTLLRNLTNGS